MIKKLLAVLILVISWLFVSPKLGAVEAASLQFEPSTINSSVGQTFEVKINARLSPDEVIGVDAYVLYDKNILGVSKINYGTYFPQVSANTALEGKAYIFAGVDDINSAKIGEGTIASIIFTVRKEGLGNLTFDCTAGSTTDSNIIKNDVNNTDIISCSDNGKLAFNIGGGPANVSPTVTPSLSQPTVTPTRIPTATAAPTALPTQIIPTPSLSQLLRAGTADDLLKLSFIGAGMVAIGVIAKSIAAFIL